MANRPECIESILHPDYVPEDQTYLCEEKSDGKIVLPIRFKSNRGSYKVFRFGEPKKSKPIFPFFRQDVPGLLQLCDYIIFVEEQNEFFVFVLELKKPKGKANDAKKQLRAGRLLAKFIVGSALRIGVVGEDAMHPVRMVHFSEKSVEVSKKKKRDLCNRKKQAFANMTRKKSTRIAKPEFVDGHMDYYASKTLILDFLIEAARAE